MKKPGITTTALAQVLGGGSEIQFLGVVRCNVYLKDGKFHGLLC
ncbi:hypothetical protein SOVF_114900 isoform A [Spinacia oleracea]|nr:hypothetical protein SOVF_114900 isoform A [Spinacia oleracea]